MKTLKVDLDDIALAMEMNDDLGGSDTFFDTEIGKIVSIPNELMRAVEDGDKEALENLPEWEKDLIETAENVLSDEKGRFHDIPEKPSYEAYNLMVEFAGTVKDKHLKEMLDIALDGKGAFRRFKNVIRDYPEEEKKMVFT